MKLKVSIKIECEENGNAERIIEREVDDHGYEALEQLSHAIMDAIPDEHFAPFNALEIYSHGKLKGHAEK